MFVGFNMTVWKLMKSTYCVVKFEAFLKTKTKKTPSVSQDIDANRAASLLTECVDVTVPPTPLDWQVMSEECIARTSQQRVLSNEVQAVYKLSREDKRDGCTAIIPQPLIVQTHQRFDIIVFIRVKNENSHMKTWFFITSVALNSPRAHWTLTRNFNFALLDKNK